MAMIQVWNVKPSREAWTPEGVLTIPKDYECLPSGDAPLTRAVAKAAGRKRVYAVMEKRYKKYPPQQIGVWVPAGLIQAEKTRLAALRTPEHKEKLAKQRQDKENREIEAFRVAILQRFPNCPPAEAEEIAFHTCQTGSGRVGRSSVVDDPVWAAVVAHIRHVHTEYEDLLDEFGYEQFEAREAVRERIDQMLVLWQKKTEAIL